MKTVKTAAVSFLVFAVFGTALVGQAPPPPPPPVAKAGASRIAPSSLFESPDGGFRAGFPAKPTLQVQQFESSFGKTSMSIYSLGTSLAMYTVTYFDFPTVMSDRYDLNVRFDVMRDSQAKQMSARVTTDSEFFFGDHYGRELQFESAGETLTMRTFVVGPRIFMLGVTTRGRLSTQSDKLRVGNQTRINKFLNSFAITKIPAVTAAAVDLPDDFQISVESGVFRSGFFGVEMTMPVKWVVMESDETEFIIELGKDEIRKSNPKLAGHVTDKNARGLVMASKAALDVEVINAFFSVFAEKVPYPNFVPAAVAKSYASLYLDPTEKVVGDVTNVKLGGVDFALLETFDSETETHQRIYFANLDGIAFEISMMYRDNADLKAMLDSVGTIKFAAK